MTEIKDEFVLFVHCTFVRLKNWGIICIVYFKKG